MRRLALALSLLGGTACATAPAVQPLAVSPLQPGASERVNVDHSYLVIDSSSSVEGDFAKAKALVQSFVGAMPDGTYQTGAVSFGGYAREGESLGAFDRSKLEQSTAELSHLQEGTPLDRVLGEVGEELKGKTGRAAVVVFSDGLPTTPIGQDLDSQQVLDAAAALSQGYQGDVCFHTVHVGSDPTGAAFLERLAGVTPCGTTRSAGSIQNVAALNEFERQVFLGAVAPRSVAAAPGDADGDGVTDNKDQCPGTPAAAKVDERGCWTIPGLNFAVDSSNIENQYEGELNALVDVLKANPGLKVRIDGHTDSSGSNRYNQSLSERRAESVRSYLEKGGVPSDRLSTKGFGEEKPAYPNDTASNRRGNRRTELTAVK